MQREHKFTYLLTYLQNYRLTYLLCAATTAAAATATTTDTDKVANTHIITGHVVVSQHQSTPVCNTDRYVQVTTR